MRKPAIKGARPAPRTQPQADPWWLDEPMGARPRPRLQPQTHVAHRAAPRPGTHLIMKAACGEVRAIRTAPLECPFCGRCEPLARCQTFRRRRHSMKDPCLPAVRTLREFLALPAETLLLQPRYGYRTHMAILPDEAVRGRR